VPSSSSTSPARVRRCAALLALTLLALLAVAAPAGAITASTDPTALGTAAMRSPASLAGGSWDIAPAGTAAAIATEPLAGFGENGNPYLVLSSGDATMAPNAPQSNFANVATNGGTRGEAQDVSALRLNITVPQGTNCVSLKFRYFSEEYPEYVGQGYNDGFIAEVDPSDPWTMSNHDITAPDNFAFMPGHEFVSINSATMSAQDAAGTIYDGGTQLLTAATPVAPGVHSLVLSVWDDGDKYYDSAAFIDDIAIFNTLPGGCTPGATAAVADDTAPETSIDALPATTGPSTSIGFSADEDAASFECRLDAGDFGPCGSPATLSGLADGTHTYSVRATDAAGNTDPTPATVTWNVDATAPDTTITDGPEAGRPTNATTATLAFGANDDAATYECKLDAGAWAVCASGRSYASLADGTHTFQVRATDAYGNVETAPAARTWTVDTNAPEASFGAGPATLVRSTTADLTLASDEDGATFECRLDEAVAWTPCSGTVHLGGLGDGAHVLGIRATDAAGNVGDPATRTWTVDTRGPLAGFASGPGAFAPTATAHLAFTADEDGSTFECSLDGADWAPCAATLDLSALADGAHSLLVRATDAAGNTGAIATRTWTVDTVAPTAPAVQLATGPTSPSSDPAPTISFGGEGGATFQCRLDGRDWAPCTSPLRLSGLADGPHALDIRQSDGAGNWSEPTTHHWTVDTGRPAAPAILAGPDGVVRPGTASFGFAAEPGATLQCRVDGGAWAPCGTSLDLTGLGTGAHVLEVRQIDAAGNIGVAAERRWTVATDAPVSTAVTGPRKVVGSVGTSTGRGGTGAGGASGARAAAPTAVVQGGELPVGCRVAGDSIRTCSVEVRVAGKVVGRGSVTYAQPGTTSARVSVRLSAATRTQLQQTDTALQATFAFRATTFSAPEPLVSHATAILQPSARWIMPSDGLFATNSSHLVAKVRRYLKAIAPMLRGAHVVRCEGHTDTRGTGASNVRLGMRRARAVCAELRRLGVAAKLVAVSRGESQPRATNRTAAGRWRNRRVELRVLR
jgi:outer membrane protein OmpA-like peptidoglycan-associated protein